MTADILVVEDEPGIAGFIRRGLIFEGYHVEVAEDGPAALVALRERPPELIVLDLMLPGIDGIELCRRVRAAEAADGSPALPILILTARDAVTDRVAGLNAGADDYLVKPFAFEELLARIRALLRRSQRHSDTSDADQLEYDDLQLDLRSRTGYRGPRQLKLTTREFDLLALFLRNANHVLTRSLLMDRIWGEDFFGDSNVLEVFVANLRRELEAEGESRLIQTIRGAGYVLRRANEP
ncbi:MAG TPA: response regulator transcription factor [Thermomicrobiales bacterium]|nr:response regulator transcription factor [Thermomicrobiales bacterium]